MKHLQVEILSQRPVAEGYYELKMSWPTEATPPLPGQFFTARIGSGSVPLLRRPFAFSSFKMSENGDCSTACIYQKRGTATRELAGMTPGEQLDILAPLGNTFPLSESAFSGRLVIIAGGVGVGPMIYTAEYVRARNPLLVVGARNKSLLPLDCLPDDIETLLCTDDGSHGTKGTVIDALSDYDGDNYGAVLACGPNPMLSAAHHWAKEQQIECYVSMEQTMGCAVGACMGCVIPVEGPQPYARVCMEGPVFASDMVKWKELSNV